MQYLTFIMICFRSASVRKQGRRFCSVRLEGRNPHRWFIKLSVVIGTCVVFDNIRTKITVYRDNIENVTSFDYRGSIINDNELCSKDVSTSWLGYSKSVVKEDCELMADHHHKD